MPNGLLTLSPYGKPSFTIQLLENNTHQDAIERIIEHSTEEYSIFADLSYQFDLCVEDIVRVQDVRVYINDTYEPSTFSDGRICFPEKGISDRKIFLDCYGFVELSLTLIFDDGTAKTLSSEYLPVLVQRGELNEAVKAMVNYVYTHQELLLLNGEPKPRDIAGLKKDGYKSLTAQIVLAKEIAAIYETSYGYFKVNSRFCIKKIATVDQLERLQYMTSETLQYIVSHPNQLRPVNSTAGVRIGNKVFQPRKTLLLQNVNSYDIYENRVVLGFLRKMIDRIVDLEAQCKTLLRQIPKDENYNEDYVYSSFFMFAETRRALENGQRELLLLYDRFALLWDKYRDALKIPLEPLSGEPHPTPIFMSVPQYNKIFTHIHQWFSFGIYNFAKENFMLSFIKISSLYESYLLAKVIAYFSDRGYKLQESKRYTYVIPRKWKYKNTRCNNIFCFSNGQNQIILYYQPVIFDTDQNGNNGIGLYRNNSISVGSSDDHSHLGGHYYVPDYLIKVIDDKENSKYLIIDAKFSNVLNVKRYYVKDLAFKYLFSISPIGKTEHIVGMCIVCGKCKELEQLQSIYDKQLLDHAIVPFADILPLSEEIPVTMQYNMLDALLRKMLG